MTVTERANPNEFGDSVVVLEADTQLKLPDAGEFVGSVHVYVIQPKGEENTVVWPGATWTAAGAPPAVPAGAFMAIHAYSHGGEWLAKWTLTDDWETTAIELGGLGDHGGDGDAE